MLSAAIWQVKGNKIERALPGVAGLATQAVPLYLSEIAPVHIRGQLNIMFQLSITIGILVAQVINYGARFMQCYAIFPIRYSTHSSSSDPTRSKVASYSCTRTLHFPETITVL